MDKTDVILKLVRENKITDEEAKKLLEKDQVTWPIVYPDTSNPWVTQPYYLNPPFTVTC